MENSLRHQILTYLDHWLRQPNYAAKIIAAHPDSHQQMTDFLMNGDVELIMATRYFLQDMVLVVRDEAAIEFTKGVYTSPIVPALEWLILNHPTHLIREQTSITLGKLCLYDRVGTLIECFHRYRETDPLLLDALLFEIAWLQRSSDTTEQLACLEAAANSWNYLTRWATVHMIDRMTHREITSPRVSHILDMLAEDDMAVIRAEVEFFLFKIDILSRIYSEGVTKKERRAMWKQINQAEPALTFEKLEMQFCRPSFEDNGRNYHIMDLMRFADHLIEQHRSTISS